MNDQPYPFALPIGTQISGYEIVRVLGVGGFGITYEGFNPVTRRRAAIKEFFPRGIASRENATEVVFSRQDKDVVSWALDRFQRSTTELCEFQHPNIVNVLNYVPANETGYMFMEQVEGETLEQWLRRKDKALTLDEMRAVLEPICDALEYIHSRKFIHRDIAPDNIMIRKDGRPMLIDFGAIKIIAQTAQTRAASGRSYGVAKQHYSPPEQMDDEAELDPRADVYALGAVLYRAVSGHPPVDAEKRKNDLILKGADSYVSVAQTSQITLPQPVINIIDRSLSIKPAGRPSSIGEFRAALSDPGGIIDPIPPVNPRPIRPMPTPGFSGPGAKPNVPIRPTTAAQPLPMPPPVMARSPRSWIGMAAVASVAIVIVGVGALSLRTPPTTTQVTQERPKTDPTKTDLPKKDGPKQSTSPARAALERANRLSGEGRHQEAIAAYSEALRLAGSDDDTRFQALRGRALHYGALRQYIEQIADLSDAIRISPNDLNSYRNRADAFINRGGDLNRAKNDLDRVIRDSGTADDFEKRGLVFEMLGNRIEALADFRAALARDPNRPISRQAIQRLGG